ncbi:MAG: ABC transporter permease [Bryobacteraceae bacterium]
MLVRVAVGGSRARYIVWTAARLALESISAHKLRSFLTLLGVIIGVASVVMVGAAVEGLGVYAEQSAAKTFGTETFLVAQVARAAGRREYYDKLKRNRPIRWDDFRYLEAATGDRVLYSPYTARPAEVKAENRIFDDGLIQGVSWTLSFLRDVTVSEGRFFTPEEERNRQAVAVIGEDVRATLFPVGSPIGRKIKIQGIDFTVVGVQEKLGSVMGGIRDNAVFIPVTVYRRMFGTPASITLFARARAGLGLGLEDALDITRAALRARFRLRPGQPDRFDTLTPEAMRTWVQNILGMISSVAIPLTSISLVVGGVVVMNIMLVSVTERTHEIGIRKSVGARPFDIRLQFLIEAVLLTTAGGAAGLALGAAGAAALEQVLQTTLPVRWHYAALALAVSGLVGIAAGWYPAVRAARLDPVVALRME